MEITVKDLGSIDEKSIAQKEQALLDKAEGKTAEGVAPITVDDVSNGTPSTTQDVNADDGLDSTAAAPPSELSEEDVLSFIKNRYNKDVS
tara:strand:+ start:955 stop:1224 length:270 start_codon:yes stop_codon:yes gene_type:complete